ncbi:hypothetical protein BDV06DRAFT_116958 [Aspergillus oleicola]
MFLDSSSETRDQLTFPDWPTGSRTLNSLGPHLTHFDPHALGRPTCRETTHPKLSKIQDKLSDPLLAIQCILFLVIISLPGWIRQMCAIERPKQTTTFGQQQPPAQD